MLENIQVLRSTITLANDITETEDEFPEPGPSTDTVNMGTGIYVLFGAAGSSHLTFALFLSRYLPSRQETDRLTTAYFRHKAIRSPFIHVSQFCRLYQAFWASPKNASPLWTLILFSICHIAFSTHQRSSNGVLNSPPSTHFSLASAHCLALGYYFRPQPFAVEALLLFAQTKCIASFVLPPDLGPLLGLLIRLGLPSRSRFARSQ